MLVVAVLVTLLYFGLIWILPPLSQWETYFMCIFFIITLIAAETLYLKYIVHGGKPPRDDGRDESNNKGGFYENF